MAWTDSESLARRGKSGALAGTWFNLRCVCKVATGHRIDPGITGNGILSERWANWIVLVARMRKNAVFSFSIRWLQRRTLTDETLRMFLTTKLELHKKEKKATRKRAHIAACNGMRKSKKKAMRCDMRRDRFFPSSLHTEIALSALNDKLKKYCCSQPEEKP